MTFKDPIKDPYTNLSVSGEKSVRDSNVFSVAPIVEAGGSELDHISEVPLEYCLGSD